MKKVFIHINKCGGTSVKKVLKYKPQIIIPRNDRLIHLSKKKEWLDYYKFTIVRNPYSRILSLRGMMIKGGNRPTIDKILTIITDDTINYRGNVKGVSYVKRHGLKMTHPHYCVYGDGNLLIDDFFKLENIDTDWLEIQKKIGVNQKLPNLNKTNSYGEKDFNVFNRNQLDKINEYFYKDFEVFKYDMI